MIYEKKIEIRGADFRPRYNIVDSHLHFLDFVQDSDGLTALTEAMDAGGVRSYYSERYGELRIFPCLLEPDGSAVLTTEKGNQLLLDEGYFEDVRVLGKTIPCIAPGGAELIRDLLD